jgi:hypothetical protein
MNLKSILTLGASSFALLFISGCSSPLVYDSIWQDKPVTIDGKANEWKIPLDYYDDKTKLNFSIANDGTNLYFCVRATEDETQKGIVHNGLQIWIDTTGGKKKDMGIQFPVIQKSDMASMGSSSGQAKTDQMEGSSASSYGMHKQYSRASKQMKITGFKGGIDGLSYLPNMYGINAYLNWDTNNIMIYEACIPLKTFYKTSLSPKDTAKVLGVSIVITVATKNGGGDEAAGGHHGGHGGGGGMGGGMGGGGMGGNHGSGENKGNFSTTSASAYIKFRLANKHS